MKCATSAPRRRYAALLALAVLAIANPATAETELRIGGTGGDLGTMRMIGAAFTAANPEYTVTVLPSLGSGGGIRAVAAGAIDLAISARRPRADEKVPGYGCFPYAKTALVVATASQQSLGNVTRQSLVDLFAKQQMTWPDKRPVQLVVRPLHDSDSEIVARQIDGMEAAQAAAIQRGATIGNSDLDAALALESRPTAVGIVSLSMILAEQLALQALPLDGTPASVKTLADGSYLLPKTFYMVAKKPLAPANQAFVDFMRSDAGQKLLLRTGHLPIP
jgi:phosphate transport system substrate-binding protein